MLGFLRSLFLAAPAGDRPSPPQGPGMLQNWGPTEVSGQVVKLLGEFNPHYVTTDTMLKMRLDPDVAFGLVMLRAVVCNMKWSISSEDPIVAAFVENQLRMMYRQLAKTMSMAIAFGFKIAEIPWEVQDVNVETKDSKGVVSKKKFPNAWIFKRVRGIDNRTLTLVTDEKTQDFVGIKQQRGPGSGEAPLILPDRFVRWSYRDEDVDDRPEGLAQLFQAYTPWYDKLATNLFANRYFERTASPTPKGRADAGGIKDTSGALVDGFTFLSRQLAALRQGGFILLPGTRDTKGEYLFDVDFLQDDKRGDMFDGRLIYHSTQILRALWMPDEVGTSQESGGFARSKTQKGTQEDVFELIQNEWLDEVVQPQVVDRIVLYNFGQKVLDESRTRIQAAGVSADTKDVMKLALQKLMDAETMTADGKRIGIKDRLDGVAMAQTLNLPLIPESEAEAMGAQLPEDDDEGDPDVDVTDDKKRKDQEDELRRRGASDE